MTRVRIHGGRIIDPASGMDGVGDLFIAEGLIVAAGAAPPGFTVDRDIDAGGCWVLPGIVDLCARFREPGNRTLVSIASESAAAAAGGVTTVCCPPDTQPIIDSPAVVELLQQRAAACGTFRICIVGAMTQGLAGELLAEMQSLGAAGCVGVGNGFRPVANSEVLRRAMEYAASCDLTVFIRPEDHYLRNGGVLHEGPVSTRLGLPPVPASAETVAVSRALLLAEQTGVRLHLERLSCARSVQMVVEARQRGLPVSADVGICHLWLIDVDAADYDPNCHLRPPLRSAADRAALCRAVSDGSIDAVCSDHHPLDEDAKSAPFAQTEPGASTIELLLPLMATLVADGSIPLARAVAALATGPAAVLRRADCGGLAPGLGADVVIFDPAPATTVHTDSLRSAGRNCPFAGRKVNGQVRHTLFAGTLVYSSPPR